TNGLEMRRYIGLDILAKSRMTLIETAESDVDQREEAAGGDRAGHEQHRDDPQCAAELVSTLFPRNSRHLSLLAASGTRRSPVVLLLFTLWGPRGQGVTHGRFKIMT